MLAEILRVQARLPIFIQATRWKSVGDCKKLACDWKAYSNM
jgi:hypothetical protein